MNKLERLARKIAGKMGLPDTDASIWYVVGLMGGSIILIAYFSIVPLIGYNLDMAVSIPSSSVWNSTTNPNIVNGSSLWSSVAPIAKTGAITAAIAALILTIMSLAGGMGRRQQ